jgi:hypothetical protein
VERQIAETCTVRGWELHAPGQLPVESRARGFHGRPTTDERSQPIPGMVQNELVSKDLVSGPAEKKIELTPIMN